MSNILNNNEIDYGFHNVSYSEYPNRVYAIGLCRGDIKLEQCRTCLNQSRANLMAVCPNRKVAIGWYNDELCMLRYSNRSIFDRMDNGLAYYKKSNKNATDLNVFNTKLNDLLNGLKRKASSGDSRLKYAVGNFSLPNFDDVYGLLQCTPDLSGKDCDNCIAQSIERISKDCCKDSMGGRIVRPSCFMRFETSYQFYGPTAYMPPLPLASLPPTTTSVTNPSSGGKSHTSVLVITITVPIVAVIMFMFIFICNRYLRKRKQRKSNSSELKYVTNDFSDANKLGQGGFGAVYKGILTNGQEIAVKRLAWIILLGYCLEGRERLLVYEFVPNKSLDYFIFDHSKRANLDWESCHRIIGGIAQGLVYLHEDSRLRIIYRDLKATNILLDEKMNPKISDFGTAKLFATSQTHSNTNRIVGTYGYMAPEYQIYRLFSIKSDVYSFGVLVLEIVSGKKSSGNCQSENPETLVNFAWRNWKDGTISNFVDTTLRNSSQNEIMRLIDIALLCVQANEADRPTMATVLLMLNNHSVTLAVPSEPAFLLNTGSNTSTKKPAQESVNEASIIDPYPR
ncbi:Cysteine-rich receptor-like protein kinase [Arachis hypogaea]|nr:Cysteine-rich receptor-like protein kinase [Arachis hypogaea]